jgi:hypothetical protein
MEIKKEKKRIEKESKKTISKIEIKKNDDEVKDEMMTNMDIKQDSE